MKSLFFFLIASCLSSINVLGRSVEFGLDFIDEPKSCFQKKQYPCAIRMLSSTVQLGIPRAEIFAQRGSSLIIENSENDLRLLEGAFFFQSQEKQKIHLGSIKIEGEGDFLIEKSTESRRNLIVNFAAQMKVLGLLKKFEEEIPMGFTKWYSDLNQQGLLEQGVIAPLDAKKSLVMWRDLTNFTATKAKEKIEKYKMDWKDRVQLSAEHYQIVVQRQIASLEEKEERLRRRKANEELERRKLKQLFRERNGL